MLGLDAQAVSARREGPRCDLDDPAAREAGLAGGHTYVLAVRGRKSGKRYETPVSLIENGERWLVAPYGEVAWVRNARAAGEVDQAWPPGQTCRINRWGKNKPPPYFSGT